MRTFETQRATLKDGGKAGRWLSPLQTHVVPKLGKRDNEGLNPQQAMSEHCMRYIVTNAMGFLFLCASCLSSTKILAFDGTPAFVDFIEEEISISIVGAPPDVKDSIYADLSKVGVNFDTSWRTHWRSNVWVYVVESKDDIQYLGDLEKSAFAIGRPENDAFVYSRVDGTAPYDGKSSYKMIVFIFTDDLITSDAQYVSCATAFIVSSFITGRSFKISNSGSIGQCD